MLSACGSSFYTTSIPDKEEQVTSIIPIHQLYIYLDLTYTYTSLIPHLYLTYTDTSPIPKPIPHVEISGK